MDPIPFTDFPEIPFTFEIKALDFESGTIRVRYLPTDERLTAVEYMVPILTNFDPSDMQTYLKTWAPFNKWYAQNQILAHQTTLLPNA